MKNTYYLRVYFGTFKTRVVDFGLLYIFVSGVGFRFMINPYVNPYDPVHVVRVLIEKRMGKTKGLQRGNDRTIQRVCPVRGVWFIKCKNTIILR